MFRSTSALVLVSCSWLVGCAGGRVLLGTERVALHFNDGMDIYTESAQRIFDLTISDAVRVVDSDEPTFGASVARFGNATWAAWATGTGEIRVCRTPCVAADSTLIHAEDANTEVSAPAILEVDGTLLVVWGADTGLRISRSTDGETWDPPETRRYSPNQVATPALTRHGEHVFAAVPLHGSDPDHVVLFRFINLGPVPLHPSVVNGPDQLVLGLPSDLEASRGVSLASGGDRIVLGFGHGGRMAITHSLPSPGGVICWSGGFRRAGSSPRLAPAIVSWDDPQLGTGDNLGVAVTVESAGKTFIKGGHRHAEYGIFSQWLLEEVAVDHLTGLNLSVFRPVVAVEAPFP